MAIAAHTWWLIAGGVICIAGVVVVLRGLFADRAKGCRRCPSCFYAMEGLASLTCPECGRAAKSERQQLRTRRQWRVVVFGLIALLAGGGVIARPFVVAKNPWAVLPHPVLALVVEHSSELGGRRAYLARDAFLKPTLTVREYERVISCYAAMLRNSNEWESAGALEYSLGHTVRTADGKVTGVSPGREFVWHVTNQTDNTYSMLSDRVALDYADALVDHWRHDPSFDGDSSGRELMILAYWKPCVAEWATDRLFTAGPLDWPVYAIDPRSMKGDVLNRLLEEYAGEDVARSERAAFALNQFYFDVTTHWRNMPAEMAWMEQRYPDYKEMTSQLTATGDAVGAIAIGGDQDDAERAVVVLCQYALPWRESIEKLLKDPSRLPPGAKESLEGAIAPFDRLREK